MLYQLSYTPAWVFIVSQNSRFARLSGKTDAVQARLFVDHQIPNKGKDLQIAVYPVGEEPVYSRV